MKLGRRHLFGVAAMAAVGMPFAALYSRPTRADRYGPLIEDPEGLLDLPEGFSHRVLDHSGATMSDGIRVPPAPDGMGCFDLGDGQLVLMRNHELSAGMFAVPWIERMPPEAYDPRTPGGVTRIVLDAGTLEVRSSNLVLAGTDRNCAGGASPWGWLSCEESVAPGHGYVFVCPTGAERVTRCRRLPGHGRFRHEAAVVDPITNVCYLTEDREDGAFYRFVPHRKERPFEGRLQALRLLDRARADTSRMERSGEPVPIDWVNIDEPDPATDSVREEAQAKGAALFRRGEGIYFDGHRIYFCATTGGPLGAGQIFDLDVAANELSLVAAATSRFQLEHPDNVTLAPWGDLVVAEDGPGENHLRGISAAGEVYDIARNARSNGELAGICFAPDGETMFVNLQHDGITLAVRGPFRGRA